MFFERKWNRMNFPDQREVSLKTTQESIKKNAQVFCQEEKFLQALQELQEKEQLVDAVQAQVKCVEPT